MEYFYDIALLIKNQKLILKKWEGAASFQAHTRLKLSQVTRDEKLS